MKHVLTTILAAPLLCACSADDGAVPAPTTTGAAPAVAPAVATLGQPAPDFPLEFLNHDGGDSLADLRGRVVLIEFWRTW